MKHIIRLIFILLFTYVLAGCTIQPPEPTVFGMPQSEWNQLTPKQKQSVIDGYNQRKQIEAENAPIESAIGATQQALNQEEAEKHHSHHHHWQPPQPHWMTPSPPPMPKPGEIPKI